MLCNFNQGTIAGLLDFVASCTHLEPSASTPATPRCNKVPGVEPSLLDASVFLDMEAPEGDFLPRFCINASLSRLSAVLIRANEAIARCDAEDMSGQLRLENGAVTVAGRLSTMRVDDLTPAGALYSRVVQTEGSDFLSFELTTRPLHDANTSAAEVEFVDEASELLSQEAYCPRIAYAAVLTLRMSQVRYTHTRRFMTLVANFALQLQHMQQMLSRMRAMAEGVVEEISSRSYDSMLKLDVQIDSPVVVMPRHSFSSQVMEANLGRTVVKNSFRLVAANHQVPDGATEGVVHARTESIGIVEQILIDISDMALCTARHEVASKLSRTGSRQRLGSYMEPLHTSNLDDSEDLSSGDDFSEPGDFQFMPTVNAGQSQYIDKDTVINDSAMRVNFERNLTLERMDIPNLQIDVIVHDVKLKVGSFCGLGR